MGTSLLVSPIIDFKRQHRSLLACEKPSIYLTSREDMMFAKWEVLTILGAPHNEGFFFPNTCVSIEETQAGAKVKPSDVDECRHVTLAEDQSEIV